MKKQSAGILVFRSIRNNVEVLLAHPGGPFWKNKDLGSWSVPKGEFDETESALDAARREFQEETNIPLDGNFLELEPVRMRSGKTIYAYAIESDPDLSQFKSNDFEMEWPPKSGKMQLFPEIDRIAWFTIDVALTKINEVQTSFIRQLERHLSDNN